MKISFTSAAFIFLISLFSLQSFSKKVNNETGYTTLFGEANYQDMDISEGTYYIKTAAVDPTRTDYPARYIDLSWSCKDEPTCKTQMWTLGNTTSNNKWIIKNAGLPLVGGYTIASKANSKFLACGSDNGEVPWVEKREERLTHFWRQYQEWKIKKIKTDRYGTPVYKIYNIATGKYLDIKDDCLGEKGCKLQVWSVKDNESQEWYLVKTN